jgi:DNA-binding response OmpR family regulator
MKILIVEDEAALAESIQVYLQTEHFMCEWAANFREALEKIEVYDYSCIILDIGLPDGSGLKLLKELQRNGKVDGVLIVSAKNSLDDKVLGLNAGADDYLTKPFHLPELAARVAAIVRRKSFNGQNIISFGELELNIAEKILYINGAPLQLTRKEYDLLQYFISNKNKVVGKDAIAAHLWGDDMDMAESYNFIYSQIKNLRKKLAQAGCGDYLKSVYGMGCKFSLS